MRYSYASNRDENRNGYALSLLHYQRRYFLLSINPCRYKTQKQILDLNELYPFFNKIKRDIVRSNLKFVFESYIGRDLLKGESNVFDNLG
jgi:hypothetical protein